MSAALDVGRLVISGLPGRGLDVATAGALERGEVGGLILFRDNFESLEEARSLVASARSFAPWPILVCIDEEGGLVSQVDGLPIREDGVRCAVGAPSAASLGELEAPVLTEAAHEAVARVLGAIGVDVVFAPVLDVNVEAENPVIGRRAFGADVHAVTAQGLAALRGLARGGVLGCGKHFPGHGASRTDSHVELPVIPGDAPTIRARDLPPFSAAIGDGVPLIMAAHAHIPALDAAHGPATRSRSILGTLLRDELGFDGVVVSDALEMRGFTDGSDATDGIRLALDAGVDLFLAARDVALAGDVRRSLESLAANQPALLDRLGAALAGVERLTGRGGLDDDQAPLERVVEEAAALLVDLHARATRVEGPPPAGPYTIVCPSLPRPRHLEPDAARAGLAAVLGDVPMVTFDAESPFGRQDLPRSGCVLFVSLLRGGTERPECRSVLEELAEWSSASGGRRVALLACGDHVSPPEVPSSWTRCWLTGCHRSAFEALAQKLAH